MSDIDVCADTSGQVGRLLQGAPLTTLQTTGRSLERLSLAAALSLSLRSPIGQVSKERAAAVLLVMQIRSFHKSAMMSRLSSSLWPSKIDSSVLIDFSLSWLIAYDPQLVNKFSNLVHSTQICVSLGNLKFVIDVYRFAFNLDGDLLLLSFETGPQLAIIDLIHIKVLSLLLLGFHLEGSYLSHRLLRLLVETAHGTSSVDLDKSPLALHLLHIQLFLGDDRLYNATSGALG